jgi:hypothetical protein
VYQARVKAVVQAGRRAVVLIPVPFQLDGDVDVLPPREPRPPKDQSRCVIQRVAMHRIPQSMTAVILTAALDAAQLSEYPGRQ